MADKIRVAIVGGGICGCSLANGLMQYPNLRFDVFESKSSFGERGAAVTLSSNAWNAMKKLGLNPDQLLREAGAVEVDGARCIVAVGEHRGKTLCEVPGGNRGVTRTRLLDELLKPLPKDTLHAGKKLVSVTGSDHTPCKLLFEDGTSHEADVVIGCDGIRSTVRQLILQEDYSHLIEPVFGGYWDARGTTTPEKAAEKFGSELFDPKKCAKIAVTGNGAFMVFRPTDDNTKYTIIVSAVAGSGYDKTSWKQSLSKEFLMETYRDWDADFRDGVIESLFSDETAPGVVFSQYESQEAPIYFRDRLCMIGDAAHAMLPWMGVGAEMATEDAAVMAAILGSINSTTPITAALSAYQNSRLGRCEAVMRRNHDVARLITGQCGLNPATTGFEEPAKWWTDLRDLDLEAHINKALADLNH